MVARKNHFGVDVYPREGCEPNQHTHYPTFTNEPGER